MFQLSNQSQQVQNEVPHSLRTLVSKSLGVFGVTGSNNINLDENYLISTWPVPLTIVLNKNIESLRSG